MLVCEACIEVYVGRVRGCVSNLKKQKRKESSGEAVLKLEGEGKELGTRKGEPMAKNVMHMQY